jgi:hypothetical protein
VDKYVKFFNLIYKHEISLSEIERMMPWELDVFISQIKAYQTEKKLKAASSKGYNEL